MLKQVGDLIMNGYEWLQLACRFETSHDLLPHTRGLVRILRAIVESLMLAVLKFQSHIFVRCRVALELIGDQNPRRDAALSEESFRINLWAAYRSRLLCTRTSSTMPN